IAFGDDIELEHTLVCRPFFQELIKALRNFSINGNKTCRPYRTKPTPNLIPGPYGPGNSLSFLPNCQPYEIY
ncbi:MAG: hypothetical protein KDD28_29255, partial [Phaeodactylibacter sp.]|nr:hypothetical protein [Phaeodactylibacter sp.]